MLCGTASLQRKAWKGVLEMFQGHQDKETSKRCFLQVWSNELRLLKESKLTCEPLIRKNFNTFVLLMSLTENSPFSVVIKERHSDLLPELSATEGAGEKWNGKDHKKQESWTWQLSPCHGGSTCQHSANPCVRPWPGSCSFPGDKYLYPDNFTAIC